MKDGEALDLFNTKFIQSSLEFYNPLTKPIEVYILAHKAQSMTVGKIDKQVKSSSQKLVFIDYRWVYTFSFRMVLER